MANENKTKVSQLGIINVQALVSRTPSVVALREEEMKKREELQQWVNGVNQEIAAEADAAKKAELTQKYQTELNERQQKMQAEYVKKVQKIDAEILKLIENVAKKENVEYIFNTGSLLFGGKDLTQQAIDALKK
ncbi:MAG: OmpH family outer membrane protein [Alphaproteobacteria bacterium]|nr:OmpH family outer membrane protein [Alphaproteobacteria bacterium]